MSTCLLLMFGHYTPFLIFPENLEELVKYRLESAKKRINSVKILLECSSL